MSRFDPYQHLGIRPNPDGTLTRLSNFPNTEANRAVIPGLPTVSKDVTINDETKVWARIFLPAKLPSNDNTVARLPILMYFHGGGFIFYSAANVLTHQACSALSSEIPAVVISVDHRLAPEQKLPAQYEDAVDTILWVKKQVLDPNGEQWVRDYGDFARCYLGGRGSGGNIAFHAALRALNNDIKPLKINGIFLNQPMFGGKQRLPSELKYATDQVIPLPVLDLLWEFALPKGTDRDHRFCNPTEDVPYMSKVSSIIRRCLVIGFSIDPMFDRIQALVGTLVKYGVQVEAQFDEQGFRDVDLVDFRRSQALLNIIQEFII
ncbi:PREDICTED: probable carboxylesterase 9 [Theobroma cacao]|uniref:Probable carboxylesterase 9 n=1 Tax=Theobroma cacao TaxID=3641 RepID=A0AB32VP13_THECC|nr:PREDICTED: probable carboxylesterase 9 [Theobroma cacao]